MGEGILGLLGGAGLFLFGMKVMTEALRQAAGEGLHRMLSRFTTSPLAGVATGAAATAVTQSSTATTVMTVGFVGAGLLTFPQALGVIFGANIGTTTIGWLVTLLGFKLKLGVVAQPALFGAALLALLGRGRAARIGRMLAGLCLIFVGLDTMQVGAAAAEGLLTPDRLPGEGWLNRLLLVLIGVAVVNVVQSSGVGIAMALVLLGGGTVSLAQAVGITIGLNIGTTFTAILASLGGSRAMRQTAMAHLLFNLGTAALAFPLIGTLVPVLLAATGGQEQTALALFHTGFSVVGAAVFLPLIGPFGRLVERLVPGDPAAPALLDPALLADERAALDAARAASGAAAAAIFAALGQALSPEADLRGLAALPARVRPALVDLESFLVRINVPEDHGAALARHSALLHRTDHLARLAHRAEQKAWARVLPEDAALRRPGRALGAALRRAAAGEDPERSAARLARLSRLIEARARRYRRATLAGEAEPMSPEDLFRRTDAMRWLQRVAAHAERIAHYGLAAAAPPKR